MERENIMHTEWREGKERREKNIMHIAGIKDSPHYGKGPRRGL